MRCRCFVYSCSQHNIHHITCDTMPRHTDLPTSYVFFFFFFFLHQLRMPTSTSNFKVVNKLTIPRRTEQPPQRNQPERARTEFPRAFILYAKNIFVGHSTPPTSLPPAPPPPNHPNQPDIPMPHLRYPIPLQNPMPQLHNRVCGAPPSTLPLDKLGRSRVRAIGIESHRSNL